MSEKIEPALSEEEWREIAADRTVAVGIIGDRVMDRYGYFVDVPQGSQPSLIAAANSLLDDSDPRKITREKIRLMRAAAEEARANGNSGWIDNVDRFADALESYLPPEK